jgi:hypothetical protein
MDIYQLSDNVQKIVDDFDTMADEFIFDHAADFVDINAAQLMDGEDAMGDLMPEYRSDAYANLKRSVGSKGHGRWDYNLTGSFQSLMQMDKGGQIFSTDSKAAKLEAATKSVELDIYGVQPKRMDKYIADQLKPDFELLMRKEMGI